jgi:hypothetical protein
VLRTNQPPTVLLHVCHESRQEALRIYSQIGKIDPAKSLAYSYAFLDLSKDTLSMPLAEDEDAALDQWILFGSEVLTDETFEKLKYLAIDCGVWNTWGKSYNGLTKFKSLVEAAIVCHNGASNDDSHELWRMKPTEFELVEVEGTRTSPYRTAIVPKKIRELEVKYPDLREPKITFKTVVRGGKPMLLQLRGRGR